MIGFVIFILICFSENAWPDIFVQGAGAGTKLHAAIENDRTGSYFLSSGLSSRQNDYKLSDMDSFVTGTLSRDKDLYDFDGSFQKIFDESFNSPASFDKYRLARNQLLLLEYSAPALADVIKHLRVLAAQRIALEQQRLSDIERGTESQQDRFRMLSERACLREHAGEGLVIAMKKCKQSLQPFDALPLFNGQGSLADGRRNIHVVRDALTQLELAEKDLPDKVVSLGGDVVITDDDYKEVLAKDTLPGRIEYYRQKLALRWNDLLDKYSRGGDVSGAALDLSLPGVPVSGVVFMSLLTIDKASRGVALDKLSSYQARLLAIKDYRDAAMLLEQAQRLPQLASEFREVLKARAGYLNGVISRAGSSEIESEGFRSILADVLKEADAARAVLSAQGGKGHEPTTASSDALMVSFK
ncbi:MAG: hypothetical protein HQL19_01025 [Candidatus Omnitrophica bacterium]|nr:hypothetical protein [Candidatus Omnitrophota bacterium]